MIYKNAFMSLQPLLHNSKHYDTSLFFYISPPSYAAVTHLDGIMGTSVSSLFLDIKVPRVSQVIQPLMVYMAVLGMDKHITAC